MAYKWNKRLYDNYRFADWRTDATEPAGENASEAFNNLVNKLKQTSFDNLGDELNDICDDDKLYKLLEEGFGDGDFANVHMSKSATSIPVMHLLPCQNEIGLGNSLDYALTGRCSVDTYFNNPVTIVAPIVTYQGNYIIDGHHRWSQAYMFNPFANISAINFTYGEGDPLRALRNFQGAIAVSEGNVPSSSADVANVYAMSEDQIRKHIEDKIVDSCVDGICNNVYEVVDWETAIEYLLDNIDMLKEDNYPIPGAPDRDAMPQTTEESIEVMEEGQTNI